MKLAVLLLNAGRGSGEVARAHASHLVTRGHDVSFIHPGIGAGVAGAINLDVPLPTDVLPVHEGLPRAGGNQKAVSTMPWEEAIAYLPAYEHVLDSVAEGVDLLIGHHANLSAVAVADVAARHGKPYVLFLHGTGIEPRHHGGYDDEIWDRIETAIRGASGLIVTTTYVRDELVRSLIDLPSDRFIVLPCGVDLEAFQADRVADVTERFGLPDRFVLCPGALTRAKGPQNVVAASRHYGALASTIFIGDGELRPTLEAELRDRGRFLGFVSAEDRTHLVNAATLLVAAPEKREHFGIIYAEALAAGTPPVAYEGGGVGSIIDDEVGSLTDRDPEALGRAVRSLLEDEPTRSRMVANGRRRAEERFGYDRLVDRLETWLEAFLPDPLRDPVRLT